MAEQDNNLTPQKTAVAPQKTATAPQKTAVFSQKTAVFPQKTAAAPQKTAAAPQSTAAAPHVPGMAAPSGGGTYAPGETVKVGGNSYTVEKLMGSGSEGDIYIVSAHKRKYALKLCHPGFHTNVKVMPAMQKLNGQGYISDIVDYGDDFELLEYIPGGNAASAGLKGNAGAILIIAAKTAMSLSMIHQAGVLHKDVKPANILIKDSQIWDCVLCDFGIADKIDVDGSCVTKQFRTPIYAAPEVYTTTVTLPDGNYTELTSKADFFSLGMTILSLWMGEEVFEANEPAMAIDKVKGRIAVPADMPDPLARICRGLLIKNPAKRWDYDEILRTVKGEDVPVEEDEIIEDLGITFNASRHLMANTPEELAQCMVEDQDLAVKYLYRGQVEKWLKPYPELALEIQEIVETRYPQDQQMGLYAAVYLLDPTWPIQLVGINRETGEGEELSAVTIKDISNFCHRAIPDSVTASMLSSDVFVEWVRARNKTLAASLPAENGQTSCYMLRVQTIDPLSDINLRNDSDDPDYAMTQEGIGRFLNKVYTIFWSHCEGDPSKIDEVWNRPEHAPMNRMIPTAVVANTAACFFMPDEYHYLTDFMATKGQRFQQQRSWVMYCTDWNSDDNRRKAGPKDADFQAQASWMKVIKGFGVTPEYELVDVAEKVTTRDELFSHKKKELAHEFYHRGLAGWLAVQHQENPDADLSEEYAYEDLLLDYLDDIEEIDDKAMPVERFYKAQGEADDILSSGKARIRGLSVRSMLQHVLTIVFAILPAIVLLGMLIFSIIDNPVLDTSGMRLERFFWPVGLIVAAILFFSFDSEGCLIPLIGGAIGAVLVFLLVKFLGAYILYLYALIVLGALVFFSIKTIFFHSQFARDARRFNKPGFEERVLEPLYYAFSDETRFDSSLNGTFDEFKMGAWKSDLKTRRIHMLIFIGVTWALVAFSLLIPKSERFERFSVPFIEKILPARQAPVQPDLLEFESLEPGSRGEDVLALQRYLKETGYLRGAVDGDYGRGTQAAVSAFQKANGLEATGHADKETIQTINRLAAEAAREAEQQNKE